MNPDARPNDHDHVSLSRDLPLRVGNIDDFPVRVLTQAEDKPQLARGDWSE